MADETTTTPNGKEQPFGSDTEGENETVMRGIIASMVETLLNFLTTEEGYVFNTNTLRNTRKAADYKFQNQAVKHQALGRMASFMKIDEKKIMGYDLTVNGCSHLSVYFNDGQPAQKILMSSPLIAKMLKGDSTGRRRIHRLSRVEGSNHSTKRRGISLDEKAYRASR